MTTENKDDTQITPQPTAAMATPGQLLVAARERLGLTQSEVATRLHLRLTLVQAIEGDRYEKQISPTYIRGYLRAYARLVEIPEADILAAYDGLGIVAPDNLKMQSFSQRTHKEASDNRLKGITWLVALVLLGLLFAWWWQSSSLREEGEESIAVTELTQPDAGQAAPELTPSAEPNPQPEEGADANAQPATANNETTGTLLAPASSAAMTPTTVSAASATVVSAAAPTVEAEASSATVAIAIPTLKLSFTANCWLEIKDANSKILFSGMKYANDELVFEEAAEPLKMLIGAPMAVRMEYKGNAIDMAPYNTGRTARIKLPLEQ